MALSDITWGNADDKVSDHLKCCTAQFDDQHVMTARVFGVIGPGTSRALVANWTSPFENSNLGGFFERLGGVAQVATGGMTSVTSFSSSQIWGGNRPTSLSLQLIFYALRDAEKEVAGALRELEKMMGPNIEAGDPDIVGGGIRPWLDDPLGALNQYRKSLSPFGRIPRPVMLNIGPRMILKDCVIESMSVDLSKERTKQGLPVRAEATLQIGTKTMLNREAIDQTWF